MDILKIATELIASKLGGNVDESVISGALEKLLGSSSGDLDISGLVTGMMSNGGLQSMVGSWLGDGGNDAISADQISEALGQDKVSTFATDLGLDENTAATSLADVIPQLIDKNSSGGSMLDAVGGVEGLAGLANKFF